MLKFIISTFPTEKRPRQEPPHLRQLIVARCTTHVRLLYVRCTIAERTNIVHISLMYRTTGEGVHTKSRTISVLHMKRLEFWSKQCMN